MITFKISKVNLKNQIRYFKSTNLFNNFKRNSMDLKDLQKSKIIPDVWQNIDVNPRGIGLNLSYGSHMVHPGVELTPTVVKHQPTIKFQGREGKFYSIFMVDPDAPSNLQPKYREWLHWGHINFDENGTNGEDFMSYIGAGPPPGTGLHRYCFLLFEHSQKLKTTRNEVPKERGNWNVYKFAKTHGIENNLVDVSYFLCQHE